MRTGGGGGCGLCGHWAGVSDRDETDGEAGDAGLRALGGGERAGAVVRDRRHQSHHAGRRAGGRRAAHLRGVGDSQRNRRGSGVPEVLGEDGGGNLMRE